MLLKIDRNDQEKIDVACFIFKKWVTARDEVTIKIINNIWENTKFGSTKLNWIELNKVTTDRLQAKYK